MKQNERKQVRLDPSLWKQMMLVKAETGKDLQELVAEAWLCYQNSQSDQPPISVSENIPANCYESLNIPPKGAKFNESEVLVLEGSSTIPWVKKCYKDLATVLNGGNVVFKISIAANLHSFAASVEAGVVSDAGEEFNFVSLLAQIADPQQQGHGERVEGKDGGGAGGNMDEDGGSQGPEKSAPLHRRQAGSKKGR